MSDNNDINEEDNKDTNEDYARIYATSKDVYEDQDLG